MTPERRDLAAAIARHAAAQAALDRVTEAERRLADELFDVLHPAVTAAEEAVEEARERAPSAALAAALGDPPPEGLTAPEAEAALAEAQRQVEQVRAARSLLATEATRATADLTARAFGLDQAVKAVVATSPAVAALRAEFYRAAARALRLARALRSAGVPVGRADAHGLRLVLGEAAAAVGQQAFRPDPAWLAAIDRLREDAAAPLPGLPPDDPADASAGTSRAAA
jgi:hypothetical protein